MKKTPYNKGDAYEDKIFNIMKERGLLLPGTKRAGASIGADITFLHSGKKFNLEVKKDLHTDFGQRRLSWSEEKGWHWIKENAISDFYTKMGVLKFLKQKNVIPIKYNKSNKLITQADKKTDQQNFEDSRPISLEALFKYYENKNIFYIQIGDGFGFYHLKKDIANLGTQQFNGKLWMRFRAKAHKTNPAWHYSFFAVLKIGTKPIKSKFNLESSADQEFPPIKP